MDYWPVLKTGFFFDRCYRAATIFGKWVWFNDGNYLAGALNPNNPLLRRLTEAPRDLLS